MSFPELLSIVGRHFEKIEDFSAAHNFLISVFVQLAYGCQQLSVEYHEAGDKRNGFPPNIPYWEACHCQHMFILFNVITCIFKHLFWDLFRQCKLRIWSVVIGINLVVLPAPRPRRITTLEGVNPTRCLSQKTMETWSHAGGFTLKVSNKNEWSKLLVPEEMVRPHSEWNLQVS